MRHKTLFSLIVLCGSTAALAHMAPGSQTEAPLQNEVTNQAVPPVDTTGNDTSSNESSPSTEPTDPTDNGTETAPEPNATSY
ncbi:hypothetical protein [Sphingomonas sp. LT1P40]|uniref:hypothetical protein n=1 Tax=Alteristakelama amylovorans TaxID=3096166 RepID=UPI002FC87E15